MKKGFFQYIVFVALGIVLNMLFFMPIFTAKTLIFPYAIHPFDICKKYPKDWLNIKILYLISLCISYCFIVFKIFQKLNLFKKSKTSKTTAECKEKEANKKEMALELGTNEEGELVKIEEKGLYQNIFITGTIGSGKTSSAMYPFTSQLIKHMADNTNEKIAMLILDVKGNYSQKVLEFAQSARKKR